MNDQLHVVSNSIMDALFHAHRMEHHETIQHTLRCVQLIGDFGSYLELNDEDIDILKQGALFHDIGKFYVPADTLYAERPLTEDEFTLVKRHPVLGNLEGINPIVRAMKEQHHEHLDGSGYPSRLLGHQIHPFAQILTIVDVYDALQSVRSYKVAWTEEEIFEEMSRYRGLRYNSIYLDSFFDFIEETKQKRP